MTGNITYPKIGDTGYFTPKNSQAITNVSKKLETNLFVDGIITSINSDGIVIFSTNIGEMFAVSKQDLYIGNILNLESISTPTKVLDCDIQIGGKIRLIKDHNIAPAPNGGTNVFLVPSLKVGDPIHATITRVNSSSILPQTQINAGDTLVAKILYLSSYIAPNDPNISTVSNINQSLHQLLTQYSIQTHPQITAICDIESRDGKTIIQNASWTAIVKSNLGIATPTKAVIVLESINDSAIYLTQNKIDPSEISAVKFLHSISNYIASNRDPLVSDFILGIISKNINSDDQSFKTHSNKKKLDVILSSDTNETQHNANALEDLSSMFKNVFQTYENKDLNTIQSSLDGELLYELNVKETQQEDGKRFIRFYADISFESCDLTLQGLVVVDTTDNSILEFQIIVKSDDIDDQLQYEVSNIFHAYKALITPTISKIRFSKKTA